MIQVWTMPGLRAHWGQDDPLTTMMVVLDQAGYTSVVATNCEQTYHRTLREGERVSVCGRLVEVTGPKRTALGEVGSSPRSTPGSWTRNRWPRCCSGC